MNAIPKHSRSILEATSEPRAPAERDYLILGPIAQGLDGRVVAAQRRRDGAEVVIKAARTATRSAPGGRLGVEAEALWLRRFASPHIVPLLDEVSLEGAPALVLPRAPLGSLAGTLARLSTHALLGALHDALVALTQLHAVDVIHLDVKPDNILLTYDSNGFVIAQLADLSQAALRAWGAPAKAFTPRYAAPELLAGKPPTASADVFALAMWLEGRTLAPALEAWVKRATEQAPSMRFAHAGKAYAALADIVDVTTLRAHLTESFDAQPRRTPSPPSLNDETLPFEPQLALAHAHASGNAGLSPASAPPSRVLRSQDAPRTGPLRARDAELARLVAWLREGAVARFIALTGPAGVGATRLLRELIPHALLLGANVIAVDVTEPGVRTWPEPQGRPRHEASDAARGAWMHSVAKRWLEAGERVLVIARAPAQLAALGRLKRLAGLCVVCDVTGEGSTLDALWTHRDVLEPYTPEQITQMLQDRGVDALSAAHIALTSAGLPARALMALRGGEFPALMRAQDRFGPHREELQRLLALLSILGPQTFPAFRARAASLGMELQHLHLRELVRLGVYAVPSASLSLSSAIEAEIPKRAWRAILKHAHPGAESLRIAHAAMRGALPSIALKHLEAIPRESLSASDLTTFNAVLSTLPLNPRTEALRALTAYLRGDHHASKAHCEVALRSRTRGVVVHASLTRGQVALSELEADAARAFAERARALAERHEDKLRAAMLRGRIDILTGQTREAARLLRSTLAPLSERMRSTPLALRAASLLADTYSNAKLPRSAIRAARSAMRRAEAAHAPVVRLIAGNTLVDSLVQCGRHAEAVEVGETLLAEGASGPVAHYLLGNVALAEIRRGHIEAALRGLDEALAAVGPARHRLWAFLASVKARALAENTADALALKVWLGTMSSEAALLREVHDAVTLIDEVLERAGPEVARWLDRA